ncbi:MAG: HD domain-containing protein [Candidatus Micrarchaeia archaeon]
MSGIKDCVHGMISVSPIEERIIDTPEFQRLRYVKQLAFANLIYPGANHTRFEHSLGTMHLAGTYCESLKLRGGKSQLLRLAGLLHDVGHMAFSHESEIVLERYLGDHEKIGMEKIRTGEIGDIIKTQYTLPEFEKVFFGAGVGQAIHSDIGADRIDYIMRDGYYTGVGYGIVDHERVISQAKYDSKNGLRVAQGGLEATESLLISRFLMFSTVYYHKTVRIAAAMIRKAIKDSVAKKEFDPRLAINMGDYDIMQELSKSSSGHIISDLKTRKLYKEAYSAPIIDEVLTRQQAAKIEDEIFQKTGAEVIIDVPTVSYKKATLKVEMDGKLTNMEKASALVKSLEQSEKRRLKMLAICHERDKEKIRRECERIF